MASAGRLHPQNDRVGHAGIPFPPDPPPRNPPVYVTEHGEEQHETPLCPHVRGRTHYAICREEGLYVFGERRCDTCRMHNLSFEESGWTDPRYREEADSS